MKVIRVIRLKVGQHCQNEDFDDEEYIWQYIFRNYMK